MTTVTAPSVPPAAGVPQAARQGPHVRDQLGRVVDRELEAHRHQVVRQVVERAAASAEPDAEAANTITHWSDFDTGGHFAAMEAPDLFVGDVREFFRTVR
jgi:hypothetical protein